MGKYEKKKQAKKRRKSRGFNKVLVGILAALLIVGAVVAVAGVFGGDPDKKEQTPQEGFPELVVNSVEEQGDTMVISTSYATLKYPYAFSDLIRVEAVMHEDRAALEFAAVINETEAELFTIWFGGQEGIPLGTMSLDGTDVPVSAVLYEATGDLEENELSSYHAAQECFNDVVVSLGENDGFTPAA